MMVRAASLIGPGMVSWGVLEGSMWVEINSPATMLPTARRMMGFTVSGFSLMGFMGVRRLVFSRVK